MMTPPNDLLRDISRIVLSAASVLAAVACGGPEPTQRMTVGTQATASALVAGELPTVLDYVVWSSAGPIDGWTCTQFLEPSDPHTWDDNYLCVSPEWGDPSFEFSYAGPLEGRRCLAIEEPSDPDTWGDNYLCLPANSGLDLRWSYAGPLDQALFTCVQVVEASDPHTWSDNYLCHPRTLAPPPPPPPPGDDACDLLSAPLGDLMWSAPGWGNLGPWFCDVYPFSPRTSLADGETSNVCLRELYGCYGYSSGVYQAITASCRGGQLQVYVSGDGVCPFGSIWD